jgi:hypothetical protein
MLLYLPGTCRGASIQRGGDARREMPDSREFTSSPQPPTIPRHDGGCSGTLCTLNETQFASSRTTPRGPASPSPPGYGKSGADPGSCSRPSYQDPLRRRTPKRVFGVRQPFSFAWRPNATPPPGGTAGLGFWRTRLPPGSMAAFLKVNPLYSTRPDCASAFRRSSITSLTTSAGTA